MEPMRRSGKSRILPAVLCALALSVPSLAEGPAKLDPLDQELESVRKLISNSQMKLRRGIVGVRAADKPDKTVRTPADMCCEENVDQINKSLEAVRGMLRDLGTCFEQSWDRGGAEAVDLANQDLRALTAGIQAFSDAMEPEDTHGALGGTLRAFLNLQRRIAALPRCAVGEPASPK